MPLEPTEEEARRWLVEELSRPEYAAARPSLLDRAVEWLVDLLTRQSVPAAGDALALTLVTLLVVVVLAVVLRSVGPVRLGGRRARDGAVFDDTVVLSATEHRTRADRLAAEQRWEDAVRERFRAIVRALEERAVLDERPGRTADESVHEAGLALPTLVEALRSAARTFDDVSYGGRDADARQHQTLVDLDRAVQAARPPALAAAGAAGSVGSAAQLVVPR